MNRPKKAKASSKRLHAAQRGGGGGNGSGNGGSGTSPKKQRRDTNKQSAKQRVRAEAAERSRLSRKAKKAMLKKVEREGAAAAADDGDDGGDRVGTAVPPALAHTPASRAEQRQAVQRDVETKLGEWRRKRARAEAGLADGADDSHSNNNTNNNNIERRRQKKTEQSSSFYPTGYYPEQVRGGGGGGGGLLTAGASREAAAATGGSGSSHSQGDCYWPEVHNASVRRCMPGKGKLLSRSGSSAPAAAAAAPAATVGGGGGDRRRSISRHASASRAGRAGGGGGRATAISGGHDGEEERRREAEECWEAPWMTGLVDRAGGGGGGGDRGGRAQPFDLVSSEGGEEEEQEEEEERMRHDGAGAMTARGKKSEWREGPVTGGGGVARDGNAGRSRSGGSGEGSSERDGWESSGGEDDGEVEGGRGKRGGETTGGLSDLHHEILRFEEYVSLTPAEVAARENLVASVEASAGEALGNGATARAFGSYGGVAEGGARREAGCCFSTFLSDVDISIRPPGNHNTLPPQPRAKWRTQGGFLDLSRGSDDGFEEGTSSSSASSSSESESSSDSGSGSGSDSDSDPGRSQRENSGGGLRPSRCPPQSGAAAAAAAAAAAQVIYVASSASEADPEEEKTPPFSAGSHEGQERCSETRKCPPERPSPSPPPPPPRGRPSGRYAAVPPPPACVAAVDVLSTSSACVRAEKNGDRGISDATSDSGGGGDNGGGNGSDSGRGEVEKERSESGTTDAPSPAAFGFYVDSRPDPALLKLAAKERTAVTAAAAAGSGSSSNSRKGDATEGETELGPEEVGRQVSNKADGGTKRRDLAAPVVPEQQKLPGTATVASGARTSSTPRALLAAAPPGKKKKKKSEAGSSRSAAAAEAGSTTACSLSLPMSPKKERGKKRPRSSSWRESGSPSPERDRRLQSENGDGIGVGGRGGPGDGDGRGGYSGVKEAARDGGRDGGGDGRLRAVFKPDGGGWVFVKGNEKEEEKGDDDCCGAKASSMPQAGEDGPGGGGGGGAAAAASIAAVVGSTVLGNSARGSSSAALGYTTAAASGSVETEIKIAPQLAQTLRAESEYTVRLTADAARLAAKLSSARAGGSVTTAAADSRGGGTGDDDSIGDCCGDDGDGKGPMPPIVRATTGEGENAEGEREDNDVVGGGGGGGIGSGSPTDPEEARHAEGLMALVREQERRNRGGSLPAAFLGATAENREGQEDVAFRASDEALRASRLQAALTVAAGAAAKRRRASAGTAVPPGGILEIHTRAGLADGRGRGWVGGGGGGAVWRGRRADGKARAVSGLRKLAKQLLKMPWVKKFEFRGNAKVPIIAMLDASTGVDCDVGWAGDGEGGDCWEDPADAPGPAHFARMFPGTFRPLTSFLKVFMRQRGLDKPFTGGVGSFKLYALIASHLQGCGCGRAPQQQQQQQHDLGDLLLSFLSHYSHTSEKRLTPRTVLHVRGLTIDLGSASKAPAAAKDFGRAFEALSFAISEEEASRINGIGNDNGNEGSRAECLSVGSGESNTITHNNNSRRKGKGKGKGSSNNGNGDGNDLAGSASSKRQRRGRGNVRARESSQSKEDCSETPLRPARRRSSILGRVIWGSDLRRERESRLAAVRSAKTSPRPAGPEPRWHVILEATSTSRPHSSSAGQREKLLPQTIGHRGSQRNHHSTGYGSNASNGGPFGGRRNARARGSGGHRAGSGGGGDRPDLVRQPPRTDKRTVAQKKRLKLKRVAEENDKRKRKKARK